MLIMEEIVLVEGETLRVLARLHDRTYQLLPVHRVRKLEPNVRIETPGCLSGGPHRLKVMTGELRIRTTVHEIHLPKSTIRFQYALLTEKGLFSLHLCS